MATATVSDSNNRVEDMEGAPTVNDIGAGQGGAKETVTFLQGGASVSRKITNTALRGTGVTVTAVNMTTGDNLVWLSKTFLSDYLDVNSVGMLVRAEDNSGDSRDWILFDDGPSKTMRGIPPIGGWIVQPVEVQQALHVDSFNGSPIDSTVIDGYQAGAGLAVGAAKAENIFIDSVDLGDGLYLVGGDGADPDGTFELFRNDDEGTGTAGRFGHVSSRSGILYVFGKLVIGRTAGGTVTNTAFTDQDQTMVFPGGLTSAGWNELEVDLGNASTVVTWTRLSMFGRAWAARQFVFDTALDVNGTTDAITFRGNTDYDQLADAGIPLDYEKLGGSDAIGLNASQAYFARHSGADTFATHTIRSDAINVLNTVNLTAATAPGELHEFVTEPDGRPDFTATSTSGSFVANNCLFSRFRSVTPNAACEFNSCTFTDCGEIDLTTNSGATLDLCNIISFERRIGEAAVVADDLADISNCFFQAKTHGQFGGFLSSHAIEIDTAGTYSFVGNTFDNYGPEGQSFDTITDVDAGADTITLTAHPFATGDAVYYNDEGGSDTIGLTDGNLYFVRSVDANTVSIHATPAAADANSSLINLSDGSTGETHTLYSAGATIYNSSGTGTVTINVSGGGDVPTIRNAPGSTTVVNAAVTITLTGLQTGTEVRVCDQGTGLEIDGVESSGTSFAFSDDPANVVDIRIFHINYEPADIENFTIPASNASIPVNQRFDRNYNNP